MSPVLTRCFGVVALLLAVLPATARAQIYAWRDASGNLVLSDRPKDPAARTFAVATGGSYRTTKAAPMRRSAEFEGLIEEHAADHGVNPHLVRAVIQAESAFNPRARSVKGAMGLMQLMPATAEQFGVRDPFNPAENIRAGVAYLKQLLVKYAQNIELALAAYNAGPGAVAKYGKVPPYRETRNYVEKIQTAVGNARPPAVKIYRTIEIVNGREVPRYSNVQTAGAELVTSSTRR